MNGKRACALAVKGFLISCGTAVGFYFFYDFGHLPAGLRWLGAILAALILCGGTYLTLRCGRRLGIIVRTVCLLVALCAMAAFGIRADVFPSPMTVSIEGHERALSTVPANLNNFWGKSLWMYQLKLDELAGNTLEVTFPLAVNRVKVYLSGMPGGWQAPAPNAGFSIEFQAAADTRAQEKGHAANLSVSAAELADYRWRTHTVNIPGKGAEILRWAMNVPDTAVAGKAPLYLAVQVKGWQGALFAAGKVLLFGFAVWLICIAVALALTSARHPRRILPAAEALYGRRSVAWLFPVATFIVVLGVLVYWSSSRTHYIFFWDYRNYWARTQQLFEVMASGGWSQALDSFIYGYPANYSMLPAVIPALLSFVVGFPGRVDYAFMIAMVYALPAYLLLAYCGRQLVRPMLGTNPQAWAWSAFAILVTTPVYLGMIFYMMPDIGGVAVTALVLLLADYVIRQLRREVTVSSDINSSGVTAASLGLGVALAAMFLYRRWYVFASVGIVAALLMFFFLDWVREGRSWKSLRSRLRCLILMAFAGLPLLAPVVVDWATNVGAHDYNALYASYKLPASYDYLRFVQSIGLATPIAVAAFYIGGIWLKLDRLFLGLLVVATAVAAVLFYHVQSPGLHHYYLLMPFLGVGVAAAFQMLWIRFGARVAVAATCCVALYGGAVTVAARMPSGVQKLFPGYTAWLPKQQPGAEGVSALTQWLVSPEIKPRTFCLIASSMTLNESMLFESWQIVPSVPRYPFVGRMINQAQVDSVNGPPFEAIRNCQIALVAMPLQQHLQDGQQDNVKILWQEISGGYGIGTHFQKMPVKFDLDNGITVIPYERVSDISHDEYVKLVERYRDMKMREAAAAQ